jgi:fumarate reductase flavoprotein subunit
MAKGPWHDEADLIVVGASLAGLVAAVTAADRGCRVILVERTKDLGGGAAAEAEYVAAAGTRFQDAAGVADAPARLVAAGAEAPLAAAAAEHAPALVAWLADRVGVAVTLVGGRVPRGHAVARLHATGERGGASLVAEVTRAASRHPRIAIRAGAPAERLVADDAGAVRGVAVRIDRRGAPHALGGSVVLACGGFAGNDALVAEHCPAAAGLPHRPAAGVGEALRLGREVGAAARRLASCVVTPFLTTPANLIVTAPLLELGAVVVNQAGRRMAADADDPATLAAAVREQPGRVAYLLFDERIASAARAADPYFAHVVLPRGGRRGGSVEDLAKQCELDVDGLRATLASGPAFEPPLHALRVTGSRLRTLGGLAIDGSGRALDADGRPVAGLYAAGGAAAALAGDDADRALAGTDTLGALAFGRLAALDVAARVSAAAEAEA